MRPLRESRTAFSSTRGRSAVPGHGCLCRRTFMTRSSSGCSRGSRHCDWGTRLTRTRTSVPSTHVNNWNGSPNLRRSVKRRGHSGGVLSATSRPPVFGSHPRSSPACTPPVGSRARKFSGRCSRCSPSVPRRRQSQRRTTHPTDSRRAFGAKREVGCLPLLMHCGREWCGPIRSTDSIQPVRLAGTRNRDTGEKGGDTDSGRVYRVHSAGGIFLANAALASRKDARDAVVSARAAFAGWAGATGYNRGQILYRIAELLEGRRAQFVAEIQDATGVTTVEASAEVDEAINRWIWYAGWTDKYAQVAGNANPVAGPYFNISVPEPMGVVAIAAPQRSALLGLVSVIAPALVSGNTVVVVASEMHPLSAISFAEILATSDVPKGVVNILTGSLSEIAPWVGGVNILRGLL